MIANVTEQTRAKSGNILALAICLEKAKFGRLRGYFSKAVRQLAADGVCLGSVLLRHIHVNNILENINFYPEEWFVCTVKEVVYFVVLAPNAKLMRLQQNFDVFEHRVNINRFEK